MAAIVKFAPITDAKYYRQNSKGARYYTASAGVDGWEPDGVWTGRGCPDLGLPVGSVDDSPEVFEKLYSEDFINPLDGSKFGRPVRNYTWQAKLAKKLKKEPHATQARQAELENEAKQEAEEQHARIGYDLPFSVSKDVTLLRASFVDLANEAKDAGDEDGKAYWLDAAALVTACERAGNQAMLDYLQDHAGYTRSGYHGKLPSGQAVGRVEDAHRPVIKTFEQWSSRAGDPHDHFHNCFLNRVKRDRDGEVRTLHSAMLRRHRGAAAAQGALVMENLLALIFEVELQQRADGHGREIKGIGERIKAQFSKRSREQVPRKLTELIDGFKAEHGHEPDGRALAWLRDQANRTSRAAKDPEPVSLGEQVRAWSAECEQATSQALAPVAALTNRTGPGSPEPEQAVREPGRPVLTPGQEARLIENALARLSDDRAWFRRYDVMRALGELLPAHIGTMTPDEVVRFLPELTDRVLAGGHVQIADAPDLFPPPERYQRQDGSSFFAEPDALKYTTASQLSREQRILELAAACARRRDGDEGDGVSVSVERERAAQLLGSTPDALEAQLDYDVAADVTTRTLTGLRLDQAAAGYRIMTSGRFHESVVGPAGTGKSTTVAAIAKAWRQANPATQVAAVTTTTHASDLLREMGFPRAYNLSRFLGDVPDGNIPQAVRRSIAQNAAKCQSMPPGSMLFVDEASMVSAGHYLRLLELAWRKRWRVISVGDHHQHAAVEAPGTFGMVLRRHGFLQLGEAQRFSEEWERDASLRLRAGDKTVLAEYDQRGRFRVGNHEDMLEQAYRMFLADWLNGLDVMLVAHGQDDVNEMNRRVRDDLKHYGRVSATGEVPLADGNKASRGDFIMARKNDKRIQTRVPGITLANRQKLQVMSTDGPVAGREIAVRLHLARENGEDRWGPVFRIPKSYVATDATLAYAVTGHSVEGSTFADGGYTVITGADDRNSAYTNLTRARTKNIAFVVGDMDQDAEFGAPQPDPEVARSARLEAERAGTQIHYPVRTKADAVAVMGHVLDRYDPDLSAQEVQEQAWSDADHAADIGNRWIDVASDLGRDRYESVLTSAMTAAMAQEIVNDPAATWIWRELQTAEAAGLDGRKILADALNARGFGGARNMAQVLHSRVVKATKDLEPERQRSYAERTPANGNADARQYLRELGEGLDARLERLGPYTADRAPLWAVRAFGPVPQEPEKRLEWEQAAGRAAFYRERWTYVNPGDAVGPEPSVHSYEQHRDWHRAMDMIPNRDGISLMGVPDERLEVQAALYAQETAAAPPYVARELRITRTVRDDALANAARCRNEAAAATDPAAADRLLLRAQQWTGLAEKSDAQATVFERGQAAHDEHMRLADPTLRQAVAADQELRLRHPDEPREPLKSAEPVSPLLRAHGYAQAAQAQAAEAAQTQPEPGTVPHEPTAAEQALQASFEQYAGQIEAAEAASRVPLAWDVEPAAPTAVPEPYMAPEPPDADPGDWRAQWQRDLPQREAEAAASGADHADDLETVTQHLQLPDPAPEAEPQLATEPEREAEPERERVLSSREQDRIIREELGLTPGHATDDHPEYVAETERAAAEAEEVQAAQRSLPEPSMEEDAPDIGEPWKEAEQRQRESVLQPSYEAVPSPAKLESEFTSGDDATATDMGSGGMHE